MSVRLPKTRRVWTWAEPPGVALDPSSSRGPREGATLSHRGNRILSACASGFGDVGLAQVASAAVMNPRRMQSFTAATSQVVSTSRFGFHWRTWRRSITSMPLVRSPLVSTSAATVWR